ncbi:hypothetical protein O181_018297 [Austropuccinia psidii MF-1]|uniref:Reverse transcriptase domain-containing protein n=1 Tax=Austropuccinia psidii MF-1 TaxID=1389203 RepID=A0A9Q3C7L6_9BASI|nr:hypothetical protein [Austropuccinia psidii MF-1]
MSQYAEKTQKQFAEIEANHERMKKLIASMDKIVKTLQEVHAQLRKASEETNKRLNIVFEEQHRSKRDRYCLDQDIKTLFNVYHYLKPQPQGHVMDNPFNSDEFKPDSMLMNKARSPSQYQDGDNMSYSEKEALKQLPEASSWPKFSGTGEYDHMEIIDYIDGLFIVAPSIPDYWITARLNTALKGHACIWYTEMKEIHGRRNWPWWRVQIIQKYSNGTWIWQRTMSFENDKYSADKNPYEWHLRQSKRCKTIDPQINIQMRNHKLLTQIPGELENAVKFTCNQNCTLDDIANTLQDVRNRTNIGKYTPYKRSGFKDKNPFRVEFKDKLKKRVTEVTKNKNSFQKCGSTDHYANSFPKSKKQVHAIDKVPEEQSPIEYSESDSMGDAIREQSDEEKDPIDKFLVEWQEETPLEIQDMQLESGMPQDTSNKNMCKQTQDAQTFLVTPTKGMEYIHGTNTKMIVCIDNSQHPLIIDSGAHCSIVARSYLENHFPNWEKKLLPNKANNLKSASGKMTSIGTILKEIIIPQRNGNIRLNPEFSVLDDAHIQVFLLGTDYQRMYGIEIYNSKNRHITIGTNKEKKVSLDIYQISAQDPLEELMNEFREIQLSTTLTSKQKLSLLEPLRKKKPEFATGEEHLGKIRGHDIELYLNVGRPYPPMLRRPPYPESLETRKEVEKHINKLLDMDVIRNIGHHEIVEITTPIIIIWHDGKSKLCGDFEALNYTKADRYPIPRIPNALEKLAKAKYITKMDCMKGFHQTGLKPNSMKLLRIICHMGIYEYTRMPFGIKNSPSHFQRMMDTIFQEEIFESWRVVYIDDIIIYPETWEDHLQYIDKVLKLLALHHKVLGLSLAIDQNKVAAVLQKPVPRNIKEMQSFLGVASYYRNHIKNLAHIASSLNNLCSKDVIFEITKARRDTYERIKHELINQPVLIFPDFELPLKLYIDAACSHGLGAALHQRQIVDGEPREGVICYISRKLKDS